MGLTVVYAPHHCTFGFTADDDISLLEAWERMTYSGVRAEPCVIVPGNWSVNVGGMWMSYVAR